MRSDDRFWKPTVADRLSRVPTPDRVERFRDAGRKSNLHSHHEQMPANFGFPARPIEELTWLIQPERSKNRK